jgi:secondary thiamine-phosphate synthase enzyme
LIERLELAARGPGLHEFTPEVERVVARAGLAEGLCTLFVQHTSASPLIQENVDPSARRDLERWLARLVPERDPLFTHDSEGPDDMPAHVRAALAATSLSIPVVSGKLGPREAWPRGGAWPGIYLWEHGRAGGPRSVLVHHTS